MRIIEVVLIIGSILFLLDGFRQNSKLQRPIFYTLVCILWLHLIFEGWRWQMLLAYLSVILISIMVFKQSSKKWLRYTISVLMLLPILFSGLLAYLLPVFGFSEPKGDYQIGVKPYYLEDKNRQENITLDTTDFRKIAIKVWYPSNEKITSPETYMNNGLAEAFGESKRLPSFIFSHFENIKTHTELNLKTIENQRFPTIILSHGYIWNAELYHAIIEEIVSQGYVVIGLQHSYEAPLVHWKNEKIKPIEGYFKAQNQNMDYDKFNELQAQFKIEKTDENRLKIIKEMMSILPYNESISRWQNDISYVVSSIEKLKNEPFFKQIDLDKIAVVGHSFGGSAAVQTAAYDQRIKAVINLDGAQWGNLIDTTLKTPLLALYADRNYEDFFTPNFFTYSQLAKNELVQVIIKNSGHANFGDLGYWTPLHQFTETGNINPDQMTALTTDLILSFLDKHLNNREINMQKSFEQFEDIEFVE